MPDTPTPRLSLRPRFLRPVATALLALTLAGASASAADAVGDRKAGVLREIDGMKKQLQVMNDMVFSFAELGMQEYETS